MKYVECIFIAQNIMMLVIIINLTIVLTRNGLSNGTLQRWPMWVLCPHPPASEPRTGHPKPPLEVL